MSRLEFVSTYPVGVTDFDSVQMTIHQTFSGQYEWMSWRRGEQSENHTKYSQRGEAENRAAQSHAPVLVAELPPETAHEASLLLDANFPG